MHPILFELGPLTFYSYGVFVALAYVVGLFWTTREARWRGLDHGLVPVIGLAVLVGSILGGRLLYVLINIPYYTENPGQIVQFWNGGMVFSGAVIVGGLFGLAAGKRAHAPLWPWLDAAAPALALGMAVGRIGCFLAGCCYGQLCYLPWAVTYRDPLSLASPLNLPLHPTQLYHVAANLGIFAILVAARRRLARPGALMGLFLMLFAAARFAIEFFRADYRGHFGFISVTQVLALVFFALGLYLFLRKPKGAV